MKVTNTEWNLIQFINNLYFKNNEYVKLVGTMNKGEDRSDYFYLSPITKRGYIDTQKINSFNRLLELEDKVKEPITQAEYEEKLKRFRQMDYQDYFYYMKNFKELEFSVDDIERFYFDKNIAKYLETLQMRNLYFRSRKYRIQVDHLLNYIIDRLTGENLIYIRDPNLRREYDLRLLELKMTLEELKKGVK